MVCLATLVLKVAHFLLMDTTTKRSKEAKSNSGTGASLWEMLLTQKLLQMHGPLRVKRVEG